MKVIALNASPRLVGNTSNILNDLLDKFEMEGIETEHIQLYSYEFDPCNDCRSCEMRGDGRCIMEGDGLNELVDKLREADGIILASPSYYGSCPAQMKIFLERAGLSLEMGDLGLQRKVGGAIVVNEHDGGSLVYSELVYWMLRNRMMVVGGRPAPIVRARNSPQYLDDTAGMKGVESMIQDMIWAILRINGYE